MSLNLNELLLVLRMRELVLVSPSEVMYSPQVTPHIRKAVRKHTRDLASLMHQADVRTCCSPRYHRASWKYDQAEKRFVCDLCKGFMEAGITSC